MKENVKRYVELYNVAIFAWMLFLLPWWAFTGNANHIAYFGPVMQLLFLGVLGWLGWKAVNCDE